MLCRWPRYHFTWLLMRNSPQIFFFFFFSIAFLRKFWNWIHSELISYSTKSVRLQRCYSDHISVHPPFKVSEMWFFFPRSTFHSMVRWSSSVCFDKTLSWKIGIDLLLLPSPFTILFCRRCEFVFLFFCFLIHRITHIRLRTAVQTHMSANKPYPLFYF